MKGGRVAYLTQTTLADFLRARGPVGVHERVALTEDNTFVLPKQVRRRSGEHSSAS